MLISPRWKRFLPPRLRRPRSGHLRNQRAHPWSMKNLCTPGVRHGRTARSVLCKYSPTERTFAPRTATSVSMRPAIHRRLFDHSSRVVTLTNRQPTLFLLLTTTSSRATRVDDAASSNPPPGNPPLLLAILLSAWARPCASSRGKTRIWGAACVGPVAGTRSD